MKKITIILGLFFALCAGFIPMDKAEAVESRNLFENSSLCFGVETFTFKPGMNMFSSPYDLWQKDPRKFFIDAFGKPIPIDGNLTRWDNPTQAEIKFDKDHPEIFGKLKFGENYWLNVDKKRTIWVAGVCSQKEQRVKLYKGWTSFGYTFRNNQEAANIRVHKIGTNETMSMLEANDLSLLSASMFTWEAENQSQFDTCDPNFYCGKTDVEKWHGYIFNVFSDEYEIVIPAK